MKNEWVEKRLGDVVTRLTNGYVGPTRNIYLDAGVPYLLARHVKNNELAFDGKTFISDEFNRKNKKSTLKTGDVLLVQSGHIGHSAVVTEEHEGHNCHAMIVITPVKDAVTGHFLSLYFNSPEMRQRFDEIRSGSTVPHLTGGAVKEMMIPLPPLSEQRRIVGILDEAFEGLATAKANAEQNLQNARALFESGLNAATTGKLTHGWRCANPNTETASARLQKTLAERRKHWVGTSKYSEPDSPITKKPVVIPKSWTLASPEQIATHIVDCPHSTPKWTESGVVCLRTTNFKPGLLDLEAVQFVSDKTYHERIIRLEPKPGDVLYSREGRILGIACLIPPGLKACLGQRMMQFRLDTNVVLPEFFTGVLNSTLILSEVKRLTGGAASPHLNTRDIRTFPIPLPPIAEQHEIVKNLNTIHEETQRLESLYQRKLAALDELKKSLLHQAFSGQL